MNKYYTPDIEEFHVGFEYEHLPMRYLWFLNGLGPKGKWMKEEFCAGAEQDGAWEIFEIEKLIKDNAVRVNYRLRNGTISSNCRIFDNRDEYTCCKY